MADSQLSEAQKALSAKEQVPPAISADRTGPLAVSSSKITEPELKGIERALLYPPAKVNWATACTSFAGAAYAAARAFNDSPNGFGRGALTVFLVAILVMGAVIADTWRRAFEKHPHHDAALADVRKLIALQDVAR